MPSNSALKANYAIGAIFLAIFGAVWLVAWCLNTLGRQPLALGAIAVVAFVLCVAGVIQFRRNIEAYWVEAKSPSGKRASQAMGVVNAIQWLSIFALAIFLPKSYETWFVALVIAIIGIHFVPLAVVLHYRPYYYTAFALMALAVMYPMLAPLGPASPVGFLGAGAILWVTALGQLTANPSIEGTHKRLRLLRSPHVKR
jgi:hypothetical protein